MLTIPLLFVLSAFYLYPHTALNTILTFPSFQVVGLKPSCLKSLSFKTQVAVQNENMVGIEIWGGEGALLFRGERIASISRPLQEDTIITPTYVLGSGEETILTNVVTFDSLTMNQMINILLEAADLTASPFGYVLFATEGVTNVRNTKRLRVETRCGAIVVNIMRWRPWIVSSSCEVVAVRGGWISGHVSRRDAIDDYRLEGFELM